MPLLCVWDDVDLSQLEWKRGNYEKAQLSNLFTGNGARAAKVFRELRDKVTSTDQMRAIAFCVSLQHAYYMTEVFNRAGIASVAVDGSTNDSDRAAVLMRLRAGKITASWPPTSSTKDPRQVEPCGLIEGFSPLETASAEGSRSSRMPMGRADLLTCGWHRPHCRAAFIDHARTC